MTRPKLPVAARIPKHITQLGRERVDNYAWLRDDNWQAKSCATPAVICADVKTQDLEGENAYTKAIDWRHTEPLQATMFALR